MKHDLEINTRMLINKWTKFVSFLLVRLKKAEGDRRGQEGARSRSHSTKTKTETESRRSGTVTWRAASEDAVSCEGRGDRSWRRNARTRHTWRVSRQYAFDSDELIRRFWRIAIRILATDTGTVFHLCVSADAPLNVNSSCRPLYNLWNHSDERASSPALDCSACWIWLWWREVESCEEDS